MAVGGCVLLRKDKLPVPRWWCETIQPNVLRTDVRLFILKARSKINFDRLIKRILPKINAEEILTPEI